MRVINDKESIMTPNIGSLDRTIRLAFGVSLIAGSISGMIGAWGWLGLIAIATGVFRFCPLYLPFGLRTCPIRK